MTKEQVVSAFKPSAATTDAPFRTLKRAHAVSDGVSILLRGKAGGRLLGEVRVFCSLNWDAAVLKRLGKDELAVHAAEVASELESKWTPKFAALVKLHGDLVTNEVLVGARTGPNELQALLWACSKQVEQRRKKDPKLRVLDRYVRRLVGEVVTMSDHVARIEVNGSVVNVDSEELEATGAGAIGAAVTIAIEKLGASQRLTTMLPAVQDADERTRELADRYSQMVAAPVVVDGVLLAALADLDLEAASLQSRASSDR